MKEKFSPQGVNVHDVGEETFGILQRLRADLVALKPRIEEISGLYADLEGLLISDLFEEHRSESEALRKELNALIADIDRAALSVVERCKALNLCNKFLTCLPDGGAVVYDLDPAIAGWQSIEFFPWFDLPGWTEAPTAKTPQEGLAS